MRLTLLLLTLAATGCQTQLAEISRPALDVGAAETPVDAQLLDATLPEPDAEPPTPDAEPPTPDTETPAVDPASACATVPTELGETCETLAEALIPDALAQWAECVGDGGDARRCVSALDCGLDAPLVGQHCDALTRCGTDGRGWYNEQACRDAPYEEAYTWSCLRAPRRDALTACLNGSSCDDLQVCLDQAACEGEPDCAGLIEANLRIDCPEICRHEYDCGGVAGAADCFQRCRDAARTLSTDVLRELEACALGVACVESAVPLRVCIDQLGCGVGELLQRATGAAERCDANHVISTGERHGWGCLGGVAQARISACFDRPCGEISGCVAEAECGDTPGCMDFMEP